MPKLFQLKARSMPLMKPAKLYEMTFVFLSALTLFVIYSSKKIHEPSFSNNCMIIHESFTLVFIFQELNLLK